MSLVLDILQALLRKKGNPTPCDVAEMVTSVRPFGVTVDQRHPQVENFLVQDFPLEGHPRPLLTRSPW